MEPTDEPAVIASGGWCAPSDTGYDLAYHFGIYADGTVVERPKVIDFPKVTVQRGGSFFPKPGTVEWELQRQESEHQEVIARYVRRLVENTIKAQDDAIEAAWFSSETTDAVHVYHPRHDRPVLLGRQWDGIPYRFVGIEVRPGLRAIHIHRDHDETWDWDDDE